MLRILLFALQTQATSVDGIPAARDAEPRVVYAGTANRIVVATPRIDGRIVVDGKLTEPQWAQAALLGGFSQYNPVDGRPAQDSTEVLVWYGPEALYFGVRAYAPEGTVRGTLADRDKIQNDDHIQFILDTYNDNRRAFVFAVNPLGIQSDGVRSEGGGGGGRMMMMMGGGGGGGMGSFSRAGLSNADLSQDMIWQSKGHVTDYGYEVEVRIPFKAVRFDQTGNTWGLNIVRQTQRNNFQDTWAPTARGSASVLVQSGRLQGLRDLQRGVVLDATPVVTSYTDGTPLTVAGVDQQFWQYRSRQEFGGDMRWGVTPALTLNATANSDFSQVEADAGQIPGDVRFALFFPELRPFFVEGAENFDAPQSLVYTRRIVQPVAAAKLIGKVGGTDVALLSAMDGEEYSASTKDHPLFNILRLRRDLGSQSNLGFVLTDRSEGRKFNRVAAIDGRLVFGRVYNMAFQVGGSLTDSATGRGSEGGELWEASLDRSGRNYGFRNSIRGLSAGFSSSAGFVNRTNLVEVNANQRYTFFGARGSRLEQVMTFLSAGSTWTYDDFMNGERPHELRLSLSNSFTIRGGWSVSVTPTVTSDEFNPADYTSYYTIRGTGATNDTVPFTTGPRTSGLQWQARVSTPQFSRFAASLSSTYGTDAEYFETARARRLDVSANLDWRPTQNLRVSGTMQHQEFRRERDRSAVLQTNIPRLRMEYQLSRAIFFRFVGQYESRVLDAFRDPATDAPLLYRGSDGTFTSFDRSKSNRLRADWLFSFVPSPGRVIYVGYGASLSELEAFRFRGLERTSDGLFVKLSYQYRVT